MAGEGSRFKQAGYELPKPLIDVNGKPMIQRVVESLTITEEASYIFLVRKEHLVLYPEMTNLLKEISNDKFEIVVVDKLTEGAACTILLAEEYLNCYDDVIVANADQIIDFRSLNFFNLKNYTHADGIIFTFYSQHPKWSFVKLNHGKIVQVAEKNPISTTATCGVYWVRRGIDLVSSIKSMISKNQRVNNEFYFAPMYNEMILEGRLILPFDVLTMHGLGTPEDLKNYINREQTDYNIVL